MAKTSTTTKIEQAKASIQEGIKLLKEARDENKTLRGHYSIDEDIIDQLERVTTNPHGYQGRFETIEDILDEYGDKWFDLQDEGYEEKAKEYDED